MDPIIDLRSGSRFLSFNLKLIKKVSPKLAQKVLHVVASLYKLIPIGSFLNILFDDPKEPYYLHREENPYTELIDSIKSIPLQQINVLYVYGLGVGYFYYVIKPWLKESPSNYLVFLEDSPEALQAFLQTNLATELLKDSQVSIYDLSDFETDTECVHEITENTILRPYAIIALPSYKKYRKKTYSQLCELIHFESTEQTIRYGEFSEFGAIYYRNFYNNLFELPTFLLSTSFFNQFKGIPAIICGAGPSLSKPIPLLKSLNNRALLFGSGSSANILTMEGIWPHFGVNIDPNPDTYQRYLMSRGFTIPIFFGNRIYYEATKAIDGPRIYIPGASLYQTAEWFENELDIPTQKIIEGYSVIHTSIEIARRLGCNPIILIGMNLSKKKDQHYAKGIERHPLYPYSDAKLELGQPFEVKDIHGETVDTYWRWVAEAHWIECFSETFPEVTLINATEDGIGFFSVPNETLSNTLETYCTTPYPLEAMIDTCIQNDPGITLSYDKIKSSLETFKSHLSHTLALIQSSLLNLQNSEKTNLKSQESKFEEIKISIAYRFLLERFDNFIQDYYRKEKQNLERLETVRERKEVEKSLFLRRLEFLRQTLDINILTIENALANNKKQEFIENHIAIELPTFPKNTTQRIRHNKSGYIESVLSYNLENEFQGPQLTYYANGQIKSHISYKQGLLNGCVLLYYPNGNIKRMLYFIKNQREGADRSWYPGGALFTECIYQNNQSKRARCWYPNHILVKDITL